jgi:hypothetical protein
MQRVQHARSLSDARQVDPADPMIDPIVVRVLDPVFDRPAFFTDLAPLPACRNSASPLLTASVGVHKRAGQTSYPTRSMQKLQAEIGRAPAEKACAARICG